MVEIRVVGAGGEYMESVVVVEWHKAVGDNVEAGELVVTVETAKAASEIEAAAAGVLAEILAPVGTEIDVGAVLGRIRDAGEEEAPTPPGTSEAGPATTSVFADEPLRPQPAMARQGDRILASPLARKLAREKVLDLKDAVPSSPSGRIKRRDVEAAIARRLVLGSPEQQPASVTPAAPQSLPPASSRHGLHLRQRGGEGLPLVLLHGFGSDGSSWRPLISALRTRRPIVTLDLPGHGRSSPAATSSVQALAGEVEAALEAEGLFEFHLVGHSLGGAVSLALCERGHLDIRSLCLIAPAGLGPDMDGGFVSGFALASRRESLEPWLRRLVADESLITPAFVSATLAARGDPALRDAQEHLGAALFPDGTQAEDLRGALRPFRAPQRIVWGLQDKIIPWNHVMGLSGRTALHLLPDVGHMPQLEAPDLVAAIVDETVRGVE